MKNPISLFYHNLFSRFIPNSFFMLGKELRNCKSVLDLGCGSNSQLRVFSENHYSVGVDIFEPSIKKSMKRGIHNEYICGNIIDIKFKPKSFDCVLALDVIEHLKKAEALKFITLMEKLARKKVIIITPNGFLEQDEYIHEKVKENKHQKHYSGWEVEEMEKLGYYIYGSGGLKGLRCRGKRMKYKQTIIGTLISDISQFYTIRRPSKALHLFCVKNIK